MTLEKKGFFKVPHLLWQGVPIDNVLLRRTGNQPCTCKAWTHDNTAYMYQRLFFTLPLCTSEVLNADMPTLPISPYLFYNFYLSNTIYRFRIKPPDSRIVFGFLKSNIPIWNFEIIFGSKIRSQCQFFCIRPRWSSVWIRLSRETCPGVCEQRKCDFVRWDKNDCTVWTEGSRIIPNIVKFSLFIKIYNNFVFDGLLS